MSLMQIYIWTILKKRIVENLDAPREFRNIGMQTEDEKGKEETIDSAHLETNNNITNTVSRFISENNNNNNNNSKKSVEINIENTDSKDLINKK